MSISGVAQTIPDDTLFIPDLAQGIPDDAKPVTIDALSGRGTAGEIAVGLRPFGLLHGLPSRYHSGLHPEHNLYFWEIAGKFLIKSIFNLTFVMFLIY